MHTKLLRSQRNAVFAIATAAGLEPRDFVWSEVTPRFNTARAAPVERLTHTPSGYYFTFDRTEDGKAYPRYMPSSKEIVETGDTIYGKWDFVLQAVESWATILKNEILEPDLWQLSAADKKLVAASIEDVENLPFTKQEQERITLAISELRLFLHATSPNSEKNRVFIDARLRHLEDASSRLGRKDWITLAMGTLTNIVVGVALAPDAARELVRTAGSLFGWVVSGVQLIL